MANVTLKSLLNTYLCNLIPKSVIVKAKICDTFFNYCDPQDFDNIAKTIKSNSETSLDNFLMTKEASWTQWSLTNDSCLTNWVFPVYTDGVAHITPVIKLDVSDWLKQQSDLLIQRLAILSFNIFQSEQDDYKNRFSNNEVLAFLPHEDKVKLIKTRSRHQQSEEKFYSALNRNHLIWK